MDINSLGYVLFRAYSLRASAVFHVECNTLIWNKPFAFLQSVVLPESNRQREIFDLTIVEEF